MSAVTKHLASLGWSANTAEKAKYALCTSIPQHIATSLYMASVQDTIDYMEQEKLYADMQQKAERYDYSQKVDGWLLNVALFGCLCLMVLFKYNNIL